MFVSKEGEEYTHWMTFGEECTHWVILAASKKSNWFKYHGGLLTHMTGSSELGWPLAISELLQRSLMSSQGWPHLQAGSKRNPLRPVFTVFLAARRCFLESCIGAMSHFIGCSLDLKHSWKGPWDYLGPVGFSPRSCSHQEHGFVEE
jgi:hypothetical protein